MRASLLLLAPALAAAEPMLDADDAAGDGRVWAMYGGATAVVLTFGALTWDWGTSSFYTSDEGWFGAGDTRYGGADKLGHAWTAYAFANTFAWAQERMGYDRDSAALMGALGGLGVQTLIEVGDGLSAEHGFSWQDQAFNVAGAGIAWLRRISPTLRESLDFRLEYWPSPAMRGGDIGDVTTDYSGMKYVLALRPGGFLDVPRWLEPFELQGGYFTRGFRAEERPWWDGPERTAYVAIGIDLATLLGLVTDHPARRVFDYYQVPYTYLPYEHDLD